MMKREIYIVRYNQNEFDVQQMDVLKGRILSLKESEIYQGSQFIFKGCVFQVITIQTDLDENKKNIAIGQASSKKKSVIQKPSIADVNNVGKN